MKMKLTDALCYAVLTITMTVTCIQAEGRNNELAERKLDRRLSRRESTVFIDSTPGERSYHKPKVIYRKISKLRFTPPQSKYGPPRPNYGSPKPGRKPAKKYRGKVQHKYGPSSHKMRSPKPRYGPPKRQATKPAYGPPKNKIPKHNILLSTPFQPEPMGFGEPPPSFDDHRSAKPDYDDFQRTQDDYRKPGFGDYQSTSFGDIQKPESIGFTAFPKPISNPQKPNHDSFQRQKFEDFPGQSYGEPPVDSYGAPIKANLHDLTYPTAQTFPDPSSHFDQDTFGSFKSWKSFQQDQSLDNKIAFSKNQLSFAMPDKQKEITAPGDTEEMELSSYSDIYNYRQMKDSARKKPYHSVKIVKKPWKGQKKQLEDEIVVGGQYAEPPARYVPKFQPSAPMFTRDDDFVPPGHLSDPELVASATNSPYVNYKNSNMAFSPQNLNDAFSIVDK